MLANRYNPFTCRKVLCCSAFFLISTVVCHNAMLVIKSIFVWKQVCIMLSKELISIFVCNHINWILQNSFDGKTSKVIIILCLNSLFDQSGFGQCQRVCFNIQVVDHSDNIRFFRYQFQFAGFLRLSINRNTLDCFGSITSRGSTAKPTTCLCQFVHIITDTFCNGFTLQLWENRCNIHHGSSHRGACVKLLFNGNERNIQTSQFLNQTCKVTDVSADTVKTVNNDSLKLSFLGSIHHLLKIRTIQIATRETFLFIYNNFICGCITIV